jgi:hypothetical protein
MICPLHKTKLVPDQQFTMKCTGFVLRNKKQYPCEHFQYTASDSKYLVKGE